MGKALEQMTEEELVEFMNGSPKGKKQGLIELGVTERVCRPKPATTDKAQEEWTEEEWTEAFNDEGHNNHAVKLDI